MDFHNPVLVKESIASLDIKPGGIYIDATLGHGGHTIEILKLGGIVYGLDQDPINLKAATDRITALKLEKNFHPINTNFGKLNELLGKEIPKPVDGLIADLGLSSDQQTNQGRGFSFNDQSSLDMRLDPENQEITAEAIINIASYDELYQIFTRFAQEHYSKPLILRIITARQKKPFKSGYELAELIRKYFKDNKIRSNIDPSTKIFMALRIEVNDEFGNLEKLLKESLQVVKPGGNVSVITFHSGEDRMVKMFIKEQSLLKHVTISKAIHPTFDEIKKNSLSRSAILRSYKIN